MKRILAIIVACGIAAATHGASPAATQEWVKQYIATNGVSITTNATGDNVYSTTVGTNTLSIVVYPAAIPALFTYDCAEGIPYTNGMTFAYVPQYAAYANVPAGLTIAAGFNWNAASNAVIGFCSYPDYTYISSNVNNQTWLHQGATPVARLVSGFITAPAAAGLTNGFIFVEDTP
jgi:hypothetical protein